jgi:hypothetical protein
VVFSQTLSHGSLLIMAGKTQKCFKHEVPKKPSITREKVHPIGSVLQLRAAQCWLQCGPL